MSWGYPNENAFANGKEHGRYTAIMKFLMEQLEEPEHLWSGCVRAAIDVSVVRLIASMGSDDERAVLIQKTVRCLLLTGNQVT